jgi:hypothetical protein
LAAAAGLSQRCSIGGVVAEAEKPKATATFLPVGCLSIRVGRYTRNQTKQPKRGNERFH